MESLLTPAVAYLLTGLVAGMLGGLLGLGGGTILVPVLFVLFLWQGMPPELCMHLAVATSLGTVIFTALASTWQHHCHGTVAWTLLPLLVPGFLAGGLLGGQVADLLPGLMLRRLFGCYLVLVALHMMRNYQATGKGNLPGPGGCTLAGGVIGALSTLMGIAGGIMVIPFLLRGGMQMRRAISTAAAAGVPIAMAGTAGMVLAGWQHPRLPHGSLGYVHLHTVAWLIPACIIGALIGARLAHRLPVPWLRRIFAVIMMLAGLRMLY